MSDLPFPLTPIWDPEKRTGSILVGDTPPTVTGIGDPVILYYTRNHDFDNMRIYNEGTGGAVWDLVIEEIEVIGTLFFARKFKDWYEAGTTSGVTFPSSWSDIGGPPCDNPFIYMSATGPFNNADGQPDNRGEWLWAAYDDDGYSVGFETSFGYDDVDTPEGYCRVAGRRLVDDGDGSDNGSRSTWRPDDHTPLVQVDNSMLVMFHDPINEVAKCWIVNQVDEDLVGTSDDPPNGFDWTFPQPDMCTYDGMGSQVDRMYWLLGYHFVEGVDDPPASGVGFNGCPGQALFRANVEPTVAERRTWYVNFFGEPPA